MLKSHPDEECTRRLDDWGLGEIPAREPEFTSIRQALQARGLPEAESLGETDLIALLNDIEIDLLQHRIHVDFLDTLPARIAYKGILQLLDTPVPVSDDPREVRHVDGCDSACESCFQLAHCGVAREVLGPAEWRFAVEQAGINPSWSALFSKGAEA